MIIRRRLFQEIEKYLSAQQAIVITGLRRVGKTTILHYFYDKLPSVNKLFLDLEDPLNRSLFEPKNYEQIKTELELQGLDFTQKTYLFLDEIQLVPQITSIVKYFYDHYRVKFFLTGSASFYLKNLFSESLAGRKYLFELYPLDFAEFLLFKNQRLKLPDFTQTVDRQTYETFLPLVTEYLAFGGLPEVVLLTNKEAKEKMLRDIFSAYFQKEIELLADFRQNEVIKNLLLLLARRVGQKIAIQRLAQELGVVRQTLYEYLEFLAGTYFIFLLPALGKIDVAARKQKKVYLVDTGFLTILEKPAFGAIWENAVLNNLKRHPHLYYFSQDDREIDVITQSASGEKTAFEVKETGTPADLVKVKKRSEKIKAAQGFVVSFNFSPAKEIKYLFQLPNF
jgi:predicted AAA+ superfamily ATPase